MAKTAQVKVELSAVDKATRVFQKVGRGADELRGKFNSMSSSVGGLLSGAGAGALGGAVGGGVAFSAVIKNAADFEYALFQTTKVTTESTDTIRKKILELPSALGSAAELTQGYYQTISAGVTDTAKAMEMLQTASKLAAVAEVSQSEAIQALTKMMAGYRGEIGTAAAASDMLLDIEQLGQASVKELIPVIGDLASVSQTAGVSSKEMAAALALLTQTSGSPAQAATQFRALEMSLLATNSTLQKVVESLGAKTAKELVDKNGLAGALALIQEASEKSGLSLASVYGSSEAFSAAAALAANGFKNYAANLSQVGTEAGRTDKSFDLLMGTFRGMEREGVATFTNLLTLVGQEFLPSVKVWLGELNAYLNKNSQEVSGWGKSAAESLETLGGHVGSLVDIWNSLPDDITGPAGYGIVGAILFGKTGAVLGLAVSLIEPIQNIGKAITAINNGDMSFWDFATSNADELARRLEDIEAQKKALAQASAQSQAPVQAPAQHQSQEPKPAEPDAIKLPKVPLDYQPVPQGGTSDSSVKSALSRIEEYRREISTLRGDTASATSELEKTLAAIGSTGEKAKLSAQAISGLKKEYAEAWSTNQLNEYNKKLLEAQGNTSALKNLEVDKAVADWTDRLKAAGLTTEEATAKAKELGQAMRESVDTQNLETVNDVLQELEEKTGQYGLSIESSNRLIEQQVKLWRQAGVPEEYIEQLRQIKELENSSDGWAGAWLGTQEYFSSATDLAEGFKSVTVNAFSSMEDAITTACTTGKLSFSDMVTSMANDIVRLMVRTSITGPLASALGAGIGSLFNFGGASAVNNASTYTFSGNFGSSLALGFHKGGVVGESAPSFVRSVPEGIFAGAPRFHSGTGYILPGEYPAILKRGERVLNPQETQAYQRGGSASSPVVNVNVVNSTGQQATTRTRTDAMGNKTIDVYVGDMAAKQMNTPGTTLNRAVSAQTGQTRRAIRR